MNKPHYLLILMTVLFFLISVEYAIMAPFLPSLTDKFEITPFMGGLIIWYPHFLTPSMYSVTFSFSSFFYYKIAKWIDWKKLIIWGAFIQVTQ